jgi:methionyl-tRNA formyltransferase
MVIRVVFLGTPDFALPALQTLLEDKRYQVCGVITQPDRPSGRGQRLAAPPVKLLARQANLPVLQPARLRKDPGVLEFMQAAVPEVGVVVAYGQILPRDFFELPRFGTVNLHASLLPKYRGAAPIAHALLKGESVTGVTIMKIAEGMDTGDILTMLEVPVDVNATTEDLEKVLAREGARLLVRTIPGYISGEIQPQPQDEERATYAPKITKDQARIDWKQPAVVLHNLIRALNPWPVAFARFRGQGIKIWRSRQTAESAPEDARPGQVTEVRPDGIAVACGGASLIILTELQQEGRKRIPARDFANGLKLVVGECFGEREADNRD